MDTCTRCGTALGIGRFCINCGHPVAAERSVQPASFFPPGRDPDTEPPRPGGAGWVAWAAVVVVMLLVAGLGARLLVGGEAERTQGLEEALPQPRGERARDRAPVADREPSTSEEKGGDVVELASTASVDAPAPAPPSIDSSGDEVRFVAAHLVDGIDETTWRMPGDGTGGSIRFTFDSPVGLSEVGLINGYAKVGEDPAGLLDWYAGNRRVLAVEWRFDDGTVVPQTLRETADVQSVALEDVETRSVTLRLVEISDPGTGRASRDFTAISEVSLLGTTR